MKVLLKYFNAFGSYVEKTLFYQLGWSTSWQRNPPPPPPPPDLFIICYFQAIKIYFIYLDNLHHLRLV